MYHNLFIHSLIHPSIHPSIHLSIHPITDGNLECFHLLAIGNRAAMYMCVHALGFFLSSCFQFFDEYMSRNGIAGLCANSCLTFWETTRLFFTATTPSYISNSNIYIFEFLHILINTYYFPFILWLSSKRFEVTSHLVLICISRMISVVEHLLICLLAVCVSLFKNGLFKSFAHVLIGLFDLLLLRCSSIFWILISC